MVNKHVVAIAFSLAIAACCLMLPLTFSGCGDDMLATTTQEQSGEQSASMTTVNSESSLSASPKSASDGVIEVQVLIDCANAHAYNAKFPETLGTFTVSVPEGSTVFDALVATHVDYSMRGKDYVSSIGGVEEKVCGRNSGWLYLVDGVQPKITSTEYELKGGESIRWAYTVTQGDVS